MRDPARTMLLALRVLGLLALLAAVEWHPGPVVDVGFRLATLSAADDGAETVDLAP